MDFSSTMVRLRDNSFLSQMIIDPESDKYAPNQEMRQVKAGHYVLVTPTPLPRARLVLVSQEVAEELGLSAEHVKSEEFCSFFSGVTDVVQGSRSWATPYALSIYGEFQKNGQCPFRNGCGYGDGRALSVQEIVNSRGIRWELQLKGACRTPFCRGGDGRAVLRSSIREFLVSEAMHHLGVRTTRALSLVMSETESVIRPKPEEDELGRVREPCAITCRAAKSFLRVGHFELFGRRIANPPKGCRNAEQTVQALGMLVDHALQREFDELPQAEQTCSQRAWLLLTHTAERVAQSTAEWLRVGFCQGNFNSDNCLISGNTMDYGPFGFVEEFDPHFGSWVGSGLHFAFMNQPQAGMMNLRSLTEAVAPLLDADEDVDDAWGKVKIMYEQASERALAAVWRRKLGLPSWTSEGPALLRDLLSLMEKSKSDWTITWRQLAACLELPQDANDTLQLSCLWHGQTESATNLEHRLEWLQWLGRWRLAVDEAPGGRNQAVEIIRAASPKYVPREWMLKDAYTAAQRGDFAEVSELHELFKHPYAEQRNSESKYYASKPRVAIS